MFRAAPRLIARSALPRTTLPARRYISTAPPTQTSRSWKSLVARLGIAGTLIYYYNTTDVFAEEPRQPVQALPETDIESETLPTIESISAERQRRKAVQAQLDAQNAAQQEQEPAAGGIEGLESEADQQGAFNPETGEINWDCPCLGGMATGPCGEQFKAAFSCFVYSEEEPKGMDCIDKFKDMQNCFREYPEVYGSELEGDEEDERGVTAPGDDASAPADKGKLSQEPSSTPRHGRAQTDLVPETYKPDADSDTERADQTAETARSQEPVSESETLVPKAAHDAGDANTKILGRK